VLQAVLRKARVLESQHVSSPTTHFLCELWADHIDSVSEAPSCSHCTIFSPLHGRHFSVLWPLLAHAAGDRCSSFRAEGAFLPLARGGEAHLHLVTQQSNRFASLLCLTPQTSPVDLQQASAALIAEAAPEAKLSNVSPDPLRPMLLWEDFLTAEEHEYLRDVVYNEAAGGFGTQFVKDKQKESPPPAAENQEESLSAETAKLVAQLVGDGSATRNRLRTSHFVRACWWAEGQGKEIRERISARAAQMLGLAEECAEAPQIVCYPGGATYFRAHHDSGRVEWLTQGSAADPPASIELDRDHYGAARVATVFVYLSSHADAEGGATKFGYLAGSDEGEQGGVKVAPKARAAAVWSNVDGAGCADPFMVHEAEELRTSSMVSMEDALADRTLPMKIGLNLWFTDRAAYPRPEVECGGRGLEYAAQDMQEGDTADE